MRINARLDEQSRQDLEYIQKHTQQTVTEIIKTSLQHYRQELELKRGERLRQFLASDFTGCCEGPEDLSINYKKYLEEHYREKHGDR